MVKILSTSTKTQKGEEKGYLTAVTYLSPARESGRSLCPWHTAAYASACLGHSSGRLATERSRERRIARSRLFLEERDRFFARLEVEIEDHVANARHRGLKPVVRLNGSSDISWEMLRPELFERFAEVQFYDYSKSLCRVLSFCGGDLPSNYHLTLSRSEREEDWKGAREALRLGANVAVVFDKIPTSFWGRPVIDGEIDDLRFLDPRGVIVGLRAKGAALADDSGFVVRLGGRRRAAA